ncbi:Protein kinase domain family protein [Leishmania donovani]|uniref:Protein kinase domain family protein n=2 Tax=Leishmania donovani TaxID=5661 RepID=A0A504X5A3_LEIDO|nr:Protein kinase domain family protein [Leishmania donovani]
MDSATAAAERAASSALSASLSLTTTHSSTTSTATLTPAHEALRQARSFCGSGRAAPSTSSSANLSSGHTESSPCPSLDSHLLPGHAGDIEAMHTACVAGVHRRGTASNRPSCSSGRSSSTSRATRSRGVSGSSGGLTRTPGGGAATCLSPTSACATHSGASLENEPSLTRGCCSSPPHADAQLASFSSSLAHHGSGSPSTPSSTAHSPDAQPPAPTAWPLALPSERIRQCQLHEEEEGAAQELAQQQHVHFRVPMVALKTSASPSVYPAKVSVSARPSSQISAADQTAVERLQDLSYAEVQEAQEWLARAGSAKQAWAVSRSVPVVRPTEAVAADPLANESGGTAAALLEAAPASLDVAANLRFSQFFRASLMEEDSDDAAMSDGGRGAVHGGAGKDTGTREAVEMTRAGDVRRSTGPTRSCGEAAPRSCQHGGAFPSAWPYVASEFDGPGADVEVEKGDDDDLTDSPITGVPPSSTHLHRTSVDADGKAAAPLPDSSIFLSPSAPGASAKCTLVWPASPLLAERDSSTPARRSLSPATTARRWSLSCFDIGRRIGHGHSGKTFLAREKYSKVVVALKVFNDDYAQRHEGGTNMVERAMRLQAAAGRHCPHIVRLYAFFTDARRCYAALEYADAGDLATHLLRQPQQRLPEAQAQVIVYHVALALRHLHEQRVVHRAVTMRNVLLRRSEAGATAKLGDFASAVHLADGRARWLGELGGSHDGGRSLEYAAPEVICGRGWSCKSDMWALGILVFEMICGHHPFDHVSAAEMKRLICSGAACHSPHALSRTGMSFVRSLLCVDEAARSSAATALAHPFLSVNAAATTPAVASAMQDTAASGRTEPAGSAAQAAPASVAVAEEACMGAVALPVSRDLSSTFSLAAVLANTEANCGNDGGHSRSTAAMPTGTKTTISCAGASLVSPAPRDDIPYARRDGNPSASSLTTTSPSPTVTPFSTAQRVTGTTRRAHGAAWHTADAVAPAASLLSTSSPGPLMSFALLTHPWQSTALPPSVTLSASSLFGALSDEEADTSSGRRPSATRLRSPGNASRHSPTTTLSDMSASVLSTTRTPTTLASGAAQPTGGAFTDSAAAESVLSGSFKSGNTHNTIYLHSQQHHARHGQQQEQQETPAAYGALGTTRSGERRRSEDTRGDCSVTVSSWTPRPSCDARTEWATQDADVSVSSLTVSSTSSSSMRAVVPQASFHTRASDAPPRQLTGRIASPMAVNGALQAERLPLTGRLASSTITLTSVRGAPGAPKAAVTSSHARRPPPGTKRLSKRRECSLRLAFETLSDEDSW